VAENVADEVMNNN